jgi:hypothetical protein
VIERDPARAELVATRCSGTLVLHGEATDENVLAQENIDEMDMFLALTNDDEDNIMAASLAKRLGCKRVLALINRRAYADMVQGGPIDIGLSPAQVSIGSLLAFVRRGDVARVHSLRRGAAERWSWWCTATASSCLQGRKVVGRRIEEIPACPNTTGDHSPPRHGDRPTHRVLRGWRSDQRWPAGPCSGLATRRHYRELKVRDGFLLVTLVLGADGRPSPRCR